MAEWVQHLAVHKGKGVREPKEETETEALGKVHRCNTKMAG